MKKIFSSKKVTGALAAIMAVALLLGGTFAWRDISQNAQNVFTASSYEAELVDIFTPPNNWEKDETINKDVYVKNTGSGDIFVRVNFDDILKLKGESDQVQKPYTDFTVNGDGTASTTSFNKFEWAMGSGLIYDMADWNGCTDAWFFDSTTGWFYWGNVLTSGTQTDKLLDAVKLLTDVDKDFEYIINVNMHAFSADQKGIEDLEDTDGGSANVPDEVKDMVNGIVNNNDKAVQKKADDARKSAEEIQAKIDAGDYDSDASAKTAAEKAVEDYNKAADKYEDALAETDKNIKKDLLEEADNLAAIARNSALIAKATIDRANVSLPGFASSEGNAKGYYLNSINYLKKANDIRNDPAKMSDSDYIALVESYEVAAVALIENSEFVISKTLTYGDNVPSEIAEKGFEYLYAVYKTQTIANLFEAKVDTSLDKDKIVSMIENSLYYLEKYKENYDPSAQVATAEASFYYNMYSSMYRTRKLDGASIQNYNMDWIIDEANLTAYHTINSAGDSYGILMATKDTGAVTVPTSYNGKLISLVSLFHTENASEIIIPNTVTCLGGGSVRGNRDVPNNIPFKLTFEAGSNLEKIGGTTFQNDIFDGTVTFPATLTSIGSLAFTNVTAPKITFNSSPTIVKTAFKDAKIDEIVFPVGTVFDDTDLGTFTGKVTIGTDTTTYVNGVAQP